MNIRQRAWQLPLRAATGAYILNSGLTKRGADAPTAGQLHGFASGTYPFLRTVDPQVFTRSLSAAEIALGVAVLLPIVPPAVAGLALTAFSGGLLGLYLRTPGMRQEGSLRPTQQGTGLAKDVWLTAIGAALIIDDLVNRDREQ